jgi:hypothetical protein
MLATALGLSTATVYEAIAKGELPRDGLARDRFGNCIQNTIHHEPPVALQLRVAEMAFPKEYRPGATSELSISGGAAIGVQMVKAPDYSRPPAIPPAPPLPQLELMDAPDQTQITEMANEEPEEVAYQTAPDEPEQPFQPQPFAREPDPEPMIRELPPQEYPRRHDSNSLRQATNHAAVPL